MNDSPAIIEHLRRVLHEAPRADLPPLIGALAGLHAEGLALLQMPQEAIVSTSVEPIRKLWDVNETAAFLGVRPDWVYTHQDELKVQRWGKHLRFDPDHIEMMARYRANGS